MNKKNIAWDLGYTLLEIPKAISGKKEPLVEFMRCVHGNKSQTNAFETTALEILQSTGPQTGPESTWIYLPTGAPAPRIIPDWYLGNLTPEIAQKIVNAAFDSAVRAGNVPTEHQRLIHDMLVAVFNPEFLAAHLAPIPQALAALHECKKRKENSLYILSNMDHYTFDRIYTSEHCRTIFKNFESQNIMISGIVHRIKPHTDIFMHFCERYRLDPAGTYLIDNAKENINAAQSIGMHGLWLNKLDYGDLLKQLISNALIKADSDKSV